MIYHSPHFDVYYYLAEEPLLEKVLSFAESAYDRLSREFDHQIQQPIPLVFYATHSAFEQNNIILNFIPEGVGAFASPVRNRMVLPIDLPDGELFELILHELTHIFQYSLLFQDRLANGVGAAPPQWFMEGMASYMAEDEGTTDLMYLRDAVVNDSIPSIVQRGVSRLPRLSLRTRGLRLHRGAVGQGGVPRLSLRVPEHPGLPRRSGRSSARSASTRRTSTSISAAGCARNTCRSSSPPASRRTSGARSATRTTRSSPRSLPPPRPRATSSPRFAITRGDLDVVLFDARQRRPIADLTKGYTADYQYIVAQHITATARMGRDLAFSPDGNLLAGFVKRESGRNLLLFDVLDSVRWRARSRWTSSSSTVRPSAPTAGRSPSPATAAGQLRHLRDGPGLRRDRQPDQRRDLRRRPGVFAGRRLDRLFGGGRRGLRPPLATRPRRPDAAAAADARRVARQGRGFSATRAPGSTSLPTAPAPTTSGGWSSPPARPRSTPTRSPAA